MGEWWFKFSTDIMQKYINTAVSTAPGVLILKFPQCNNNKATAAVVISRLRISNNGELKEI